MNWSPWPVPPSRDTANESTCLGIIYSIVPRLWIYYLYDKFVVKTFRRLTRLDIKGFVQFTMERLYSHVALICLGVGHSYYYFILLFIEFVRMVLILRFLKCDMVK